MIYNEDMQLQIIRFLISNDEVFARGQSILEVDYFDDTLKPMVRYIKEYAENYHIVPPPNLISAHSGISITTVDSVVSQNTSHIDAFLDLYEGFCKHRALEKAVFGATKQLESGDYGAVEQAVKDAIKISLQKNLGTDYWLDPKGRLERMLTRDAKISTGWKAIDDLLYGGFDKGALNIFAGSAGMGKSLFLQNIMRTWSNMGLNTVYISLELPEDLIAMRLDAMETGIRTKEIPKRLDDVHFKVLMNAKKAGSRQIKQMPQGSTVNDIRAYLTEYMIQTGIVPQALCIDYLDLLHPNAKINLSDAFTKDKMVSEELRGLATEMGVYLVTASQLNRSATTAAEESGNKPDFNHSHIAGGISKINTADVVATIYKDKKMEDEGLFRVQFIKTRSSNGVGRKIYLGFDAATMIIHDCEQPEFIEEVSAMPTKLSSNEVMNKAVSIREEIKNRNNNKKTENDSLPEEAKQGSADQRSNILAKLKSLSR